MMEDDDEMFECICENEDRIETTLNAVVQAVREQVRSEIKAKIASLEKENAELSQYRDSAVEMQRKTREMELIMVNAEQNAKQATLEKLLEPFTTQVWYAEEKYEYIHRKCSKCDEERMRHFTSPSGRELTEPCQCADKEPVYRPVKVSVVKISISRKSNNNTWYYFIPNLIERELKSARLCRDDDFENVNSCGGLIFLDRRTAKRFCDWKNKKNEREV